MRAGGLTYWLEIYEPMTTRTGFGSQSVEWVQHPNIRAERVRLSGGRRIEGDEIFYAYTAEWNIRATHNVGEGWRVREVGGKLYEVVTIEPNRHRGYITLRTQRVNE